jgi:hypothetical protein
MYSHVGLIGSFIVGSVCIGNFSVTRPTKIFEEDSKILSYKTVQFYAE